MKNYNLNAFCCNDQFDVKVTNTKTGVSIDVSPKDKSKVDTLQKFVAAYDSYCEEFCNDEKCCCC